MLSKTVVYADLIRIYVHKSKCSLTKEATSHVDTTINLSLIAPKLLISALTCRNKY